MRPFASSLPPEPSASGPPRAAAVLLAAGRSTRMRAALPPGEQPELRKPYLELGGKTLLERSLDAFGQSAAIGELILVVHPPDRPRVEAILDRHPARPKLRAIVAGGSERIDSVRAGVEASSPACDVVLVHDVARPFVTPPQIERVVAATRADGAALLAIPVNDTLKRSLDGEFAAQTLDRRQLWAAQTPQGLRRERYLEALERARAEAFVPTDDAALHERYFGPVRIVEGSPRNFKLTTPDDLALARALLTQA